MRAAKKGETPSSVGLDVNAIKKHGLYDAKVNPEGKNYVKEGEDWDQFTGVKVPSLSEVALNSGNRKMSHAASDSGASPSIYADYNPGAVATSHMVDQAGVAKIQEAYNKSANNEADKKKVDSAKIGEVLRGLGSTLSGASSGLLGIPWQDKAYLQKQQAKGSKEAQEAAAAERAATREWQAGQKEADRIHQRGLQSDSLANKEKMQGNEFSFRDKSQARDIAAARAKQDRDIAANISTLNKQLASRKELAAQSKPPAAGGGGIFDGIEAVPIEAEK